ncbi:hypothetical protein DSO57_1033739 [Entomophthora muscae]|uniref:Uncharacterized protein n=1 Tax=Entomophthora muscae TaxID=34485 RepID=A0ACC2UKM3_9FUNG|nr:hypothetical protein DSO57_1033739 [Entomophthora muscae]
MNLKQGFLQEQTYLFRFTHYANSCTQHSVLSPIVLLLPPYSTSLPTLKLTLRLSVRTSPSTRIRSCFLLRSSLSTTVTGSVLIPSETQRFSKIIINLSLLSFPSLEKMRILLPHLLPASQAWSKVHFPLEDKIRILNPSLQDFIVHHELPDKLDFLIKEVVNWNWKYLLTKSSSTSKLSPNAKTFSSKTTTLPAPLPGTEPKPGRGFVLPQRRSLEEEKIIFDYLLALFPLSKQSNPVTFSKSLNSLISKDSSISLTVLVTVKVKVLLDTGADAKLIKKNLADTLRLPLYGPLDVKVGNSTYTDTSSITQPVTFDLEGSPFCSISLATMCFFMHPSTPICPSLCPPASN